jgi:hypothetical protein
MNKGVVITLGVVVGVAATVGGFLLWADQPAAPDAQPIQARFEKALVENSGRNRRVLAFRYALRNITHRDIRIESAVWTLYAQRNNGTLQNVSDIVSHDYKPDDGMIPAGKTASYVLHPQLPYAPLEDCKVQPVDDPSDEQLVAYLRSCFQSVRGFVMTRGDELRIDMPFSSDKSKD